MIFNTDHLSVENDSPHFTTRGGEHAKAHDPKMETIIFLLIKTIDVEKMNFAFRESYLEGEF